MGLFDQNVDPFGGQALEPGPALDPMLSGVMPQTQAPPPMLERPVPPQAPAQPGTPQKILAMALLGLAAGLGPRKGTGIAQGLLAGQHDNDVQRQTQFRNDQAQYQQQEQNYLREEALRVAQARSDAMLEQRRQQALQQAIGSIRNEVKTLSTKEEYDKRVEGYAGILQSAGYRLDANFLRTAAPFTAPSAKDKAAKALDAFLANPLVKEQLKNDPNAIMNGSMQIDLNDDGVAEVVPVARVMEAAGRSPLLDPSGKPVAFAPATESGGSEFQMAYQAKLDRFKAENNREPTPKEKDQIITEARRTPAQPKGAGSDGPKPMTQGQRVNTIRSYQRDWNRAIQPVLDRQQATAKLDSGLAALDRGNRPAATEIILIAFQKMQDETSVVREAEYGRPGEMQSLRNRIEAAATRLLTGGSNITDAELRNLASEGKLLSADVSKITERQLQDYRQSIEETLDEASIKHTQVFGQGTIGKRGAAPATGGEEVWVRDPTTGKMKRQVQ